MPEGNLRIQSKGNSAQYFQINKQKDTIGSYIPKESINLAKALAQKSYNQKLLKNIQTEIKKFQKIHTEENPERIYSKLSESRQALVKPLIPNTDYMEKKWKNEPYIPKKIDNLTTEFFTDNGEQVRSKSEILIANTLAKNNISYKYEKPLQLGAKIIYPDFTLYSRRKKEVIYWEHFGMVDDADYANNMVAKINLYENNGIYIGANLIATFETAASPISTKKITNIIQYYLQ